MTTTSARRAARRRSVEAPATQPPQSAPEHGASVDFWFYPCDLVSSPSREWHRQVGAAVASVAHALAAAGPQHVLWIHVGTVNGHPIGRDAGWPALECVSFRGRAPASVVRALVTLRTSRQCAVSRGDPLAAEMLVPWGCLLDGSLIKLIMIGPENEAYHRDFTGLPTICARDAAEDQALQRVFDREDAAALRAYVATR